MNNMDTNTWKWFYLDQLFSIDTGKDLIYSELSPGEYPVIGHKAENNGVTTTTQYLATHKLYDCTKTISLADRGNFYASVQTHDFYVGTRVKALVAKFEAKIETLLYICVLINKEQYRFSYGRNCCDRISEFKIKLPITPEGTPDWKYMEDFVKDQIIPQLPKKAQRVWLQKYDITPQQDMKMQLHTDEWKWFLLKDLFQLKRGKRLTEYDREKGDIPFVTAGIGNNGVSEYISNEVELYKNAITIDMFGCAFYRNYTFACDDNILVLTNDKLNYSSGLFIASIIDRDKYKFAYGRQYRQKSFNKHKIKLPVTPSGEPDWQFMEDYIKSLPFSRNIEPSKPNEVVDELMEVKKRVIEMQNQLAAQRQASINNYGTVNIYEK